MTRKVICLAIIIAVTMLIVGCEANKDYTVNTPDSDLTGAVTDIEQETKQKEDTSNTEKGPSEGLKGRGTKEQKTNNTAIENPTNDTQKNDTQEQKTSDKPQTKKTTQTSQKPNAPKPEQTKKTPQKTQPKRSSISKHLEPGRHTELERHAVSYVNTWYSNKKLPAIPRKATLDSIALDYVKTGDSNKDVGMSTVSLILQASSDITESGFKKLLNRLDNDLDKSATAYGTAVYTHDKDVHIAIIQELKELTLSPAPPSQTPEPSEPSKPSPPKLTHKKDMEQQAFAEVNRIRAEAGTNALAWDESLAKTARKYIASVVKTGDGDSVWGLVNDNFANPSSLNKSVKSALKRYMLGTVNSDKYTFPYIDSNEHKKVGIGVYYVEDSSFIEKEYYIAIYIK
jgi:uncharacterized protein YkwD